MVKIFTLISACISRCIHSLPCSHVLCGHLDFVPNSSSSASLAASSSSLRMSANSAAMPLCSDWVACPALLRLSTSNGETAEICGTHHLAPETSGRGWMTCFVVRAWQRDPAVCSRDSTVITRAFKLQIACIVQCISNKRQLCQHQQQMPTSEDWHQWLLLPAQVSESADGAQNQLSHP